MIINQRLSTTSVRLDSGKPSGETSLPFSKFEQQIIYLIMIRYSQNTQDLYNGSPERLYSFLHYYISDLQQLLRQPASDEERQQLKEHLLIVQDWMNHKENFIHQCTRLSLADTATRLSPDDLFVDSTMVRNSLRILIPDSMHRFALQESSGIVVTKQGILVHGDSDNPNVLHLLDRNTGVYLQDIPLPNKITQPVQYAVPGDDWVPNGDWEDMALVQYNPLTIALWDNGRTLRYSRQFRIKKPGRIYIIRLKETADKRMDFDRVLAVTKRPREIEDSSQFNLYAVTVESLTYNPDDKIFVAITKFKKSDLIKKSIRARGSLFAFRINPGDHYPHQSKLIGNLHDKVRAFYGTNLPVEGIDWASSPSGASYYNKNYYVLCHENKSPYIIKLNRSFNITGIARLSFGYIKPEGIFVNDDGIWICDEGWALSDSGFDAQGRKSRSFIIHIQKTHPIFKQLD